VGYPFCRVAGRETLWWRWSSSASEVPGAQWHELCCTEGVLWDLREGEETH
jgi:hypothetical protein